MRVLILGLLLAACGKQETCSVEPAEGGALVKCPDGSEEFLAEGKAGQDGLNGSVGALGPEGAQGPKGDSGAMGPQGPQGAVGSPGGTIFVWDALGNKIGRYLGTASVRSYYVELPDSTRIVAQNDGTAAAISGSGCYYDQPGCTGACYINAPLNYPLHVNDTYARYYNSGSGGSTSYHKVVSFSTGSVEMRSMDDLSCSNFPSGSVFLTRWANVIPYTFSPSTYPQPLDIHPE